jgi:hypothetical protein
MDFLWSGNSEAIYRKAGAGGRESVLAFRISTDPLGNPRRVPGVGFMKAV